MNDPDTTGSTPLHWAVRFVKSILLPVAHDMSLSDHRRRLMVYAKVGADVCLTTNFLLL